MNPTSLVNLPPELMRRSGSAAIGAAPQATRVERLWALAAFGVVVATVLTSLLA